MIKPEALPRRPTPLSIVVALVGISALASAFLFWLVYAHQPSDVQGTHLAFLPALNALFNTLSAIALSIGFHYIRQGAITRHRNAMFVAFFFSTLFLVSYITNHAMHGDTHFPTSHPVARFLYLWVLLLPHILASVVALPFILVTFFLSLSGRYPLHRRVARYTFPMWLYVSVSGVVVYAMLAVYR